MNNDNTKNEQKQSTDPRRKYAFFLAAVIIFMLGFGSALLLEKIADQSARQSPTSTSTPIVIDKSKAKIAKKNVDFNIFWDVWDYLKNDYVEPEVEDSKLFYGAMQGMVASLQDPYSVFFEPITSEKFQQEIAGSFEGIGAEIGLRNNVITIVSPLSGSPSEKAGLRAEDAVLNIDGKDTKAMPLEEAVNLIRGKRGTKVKLIIFRKGEKEPLTFEVTRDVIAIKSVEWSALDNGVVHLKLKYFNEDTLENFKKAINEFIVKKPKGIILDLRNNPGGLLSTAIEISSYWTGGDDIVVIEQSRDSTYIGEKSINKNALLRNIPTVILINKGSASGSEILAGALQDYKLAEIIGETSFGKGSVQDFKKFKDGSSLKLTIAKWLTPSGREINNKGIEPDQRVELTDEDWDKGKDPQLAAAIAFLKKR